MHTGEPFNQTALYTSTSTSNNLEQPENPKNGLNIGSTAIWRRNLEHIKEKESEALFKRAGRKLGSLTTGRDILAHCVKI